MKKFKTDIPVELMNAIQTAHEYSTILMFNDAKALMACVGFNPLDSTEEAYREWWTDSFFRNILPMHPNIYYGVRGKQQPGESKEAFLERIEREANTPKHGQRTSMEIDGDFIDDDDDEANNNGDDVVVFGEMLYGDKDVIEYM